MKYSALFILTITFFLALLVWFFIDMAYVIFPNCPLDRISSISENNSLCYIITILFLLAVSFITSLVILSVFSLFSKMVSFGSKNQKIGEVMVSQGFVSKEELDDALLEQKQKFGEILIQERIITLEQLETALDYQEKTNLKLGEALKRLGYISDKNIELALRKMHRRLGEIFVDKGFYTQSEINRLLI